MKRKELFRLKKVICEENFCFEDIEEGVEIPNTDLPAGSTVNTENSQTTVTFQSCMVDIITIDHRKVFQVNFEVFIIKKIVINRPGLTPLTLEFSFIKEFSVILNCRPEKLCPPDLKKLKCKVWEFTITDSITLNPAANTFDDTLIIKGIVKIEENVQVPLEVGVFRKKVCLTELVIAIGKIRQVIPTGFFKDDLLALLFQVKKLLEQGLVFESLAILSTVIEKLIFRRKKRNQIPINLAIDDLLRLKQCILDHLPDLYQKRE
ncbi:MAG: hypothetical protein MI740_03855 [Halanaerobiales bacterium]|nr:hypothetical protein [Halanaerobiales bacterium]